MASASPLRRCFVHVGLPKTGTSYVQSVLGASGPALAAQGLTLLPTGTSPHKVMLALRDLVREELDQADTAHAFDGFAAEAAALETGDVLLSQELLGLAETEQARRLVAALPDYEVHLVITLRDLTHQLPSLWQQLVKARSRSSFAEFLTLVTTADVDALRGYNVLGTLTAWRDVVPAARTHVVLVPPRGSGSRVLLDRFCGVLGVDPATLDTGHPRVNPSLGAVQAELLRRVNVALGDRLPHPRAGYRGPGKRFLAERVLVAQSGRATQVPEQLRGWVEERTALITATLSAGGYDVVGEPGDLGPDPAGFDATGVETTPDELVDAAAEALAAILVDRAENASDVTRLRAEVDRLRGRVEELEGSPGEGWRGLARDVRRRLR